MSTRSDIGNKTVKPVLLGFCRWTSVRGMPHIVRSNHPVLSKVWAVFVIIMLVSNIVLVALLLKRYYKGNTIENIKTERRASIEFPSVTVCNVDPINTDKMLCLRDAIKDPTVCGNVEDHEFVLRAYKLARNLTAREDIAGSDKIAEDSTQISILYKIIGRKIASLIGHSRAEMIIDELCKVYFYDQNKIFDGNLYSMPCSKSHIIYTPIVNPHYFNCYRLTVGNETFSKSIRKISMVLYLDEEEDLLCQPHCTHEVTEWLGAKAVVHPAYTYPEIEKQGLNLLPGASNQLLIKEVRKSDSINVRSAPCVQGDEMRQRVDTSSTKEGQNVLMNYTDDLCISLEYQKIVIKSCDCVDSSAPIPTLFRNRSQNLPFCGNLSHPRYEYMNKCKHELKSLHGKAIYDTCRISCKKLEYFVELTQLRWPQKPQILNYYKKFKNRVYYDRKLKVYETIENITNDQDKLKKLLRLDTFEKNFLQIEIIRANFDVIYYKENQEYTLPTFLSQIGGICSIFLGVTFVTLLELVELLYRIYLAMKGNDIVEHTEQSKPENHAECSNDKETRA